MKKFLFAVVMLFGVSMSFGQWTTNADNELLKLMFQNVNNDSIGDATGLRGSTTADSFYIGLYTASPGKSGTQSTNEVSYTGYARVGIVRSDVGFTVTADTCYNAALVSFPQCSGGSATATYFGIGSYKTGAGKLIAYGQLTNSASITTNITPQYQANTLKSWAN